jgi:predicted AAA+ superfamily ATPase
MPVVVVLGARQTGKSTLVQSLPVLAGRPYLSLDDLDARTQADADGEAFVARSPMLVIDEVQRSPDLLIAVKRAVDLDRQRTPGMFVLTGSANLLVMEKVSESLAGRAVYVTLWPFTRRERHGLGTTGPWSELLAEPFSHWPKVLDAHGGPEESWTSAVRLGGFPTPSHRITHESLRPSWYGGYVQTYLERDLRTLRAVESLSDFRRLMAAACLRIGSLLNQAELGRDIGISQPQVHRFLNILEATYQAIRLPAYSVNRTKRLIKTPKLYWCDTALALHVAGETEPRGAHLENLVLVDLLAWRDLEVHRPEVLYWRTATGQEVDFVVETPKRLLPIEVKASTRVSAADVKGLEAFLDEYPDLTDGGLLLYGGKETYRFTKRVLVAPWWKVA